MTGEEVTEDSSGKAFRKDSRKISSQGKCKDCDKDAQAEFMACVRCLHRFHVFGCESNDDQCTRTFLGNWPGVLSRYPSFGYTCDDCRENDNLKNEDILVNRLALMEENITFLVQEMKSMKQNSSTPQYNKLFPALPVTGADRVSNNQSVIVIKNNNDTDVTHDENMTKLKDAAVESSAAVVKTYKNGVKDTVLVCQNEASKNKLLPHVNDIFPQHKVSTPQSRLPTITIKDIESNISKEDLLKAVQKQNSENGLTEVTEDNFKIIFIRKVESFHTHLPDTYQAVVRVSDQIRDSIKVAFDYVYINLQRCKVWDRLFVRRCNKCQDFKHFHKQCKSEKNICGKCGEEHDTRQCQSDIKKCINCSRNKFSDTEHETSWSKCPSYKREQEKLEKTIPYYYTKNL